MSFAIGLILGFALGATRTWWQPKLQGVLALIGDKLRGKPSGS